MNIFGEEQDVRAHIESIDAFSAHADRNELLGLVKQSTGPFKKIILTHGQEDQSEALVAPPKEMHPQSQVVIPNLHDKMDL